MRLDPYYEKLFKKQDNIIFSYRNSMKNNDLLKKGNSIIINIKIVGLLNRAVLCVAEGC